MKLIKAIYEHEGGQFHTVFKPINTGCLGCAFEKENTTFCADIPCDTEPYFILKEVEPETTSIKPFDLEAAKRGEPIQYSGGTPCDFIGVRKDGRIVIESQNNGLCSVAEDSLCMAPRKKTVWVNLYLPDHAYHYETEAMAASCGSRSGRIGNRAYPVEIEE